MSVYFPLGLLKEIQDKREATRVVRSADAKQLAIAALDGKRKKIARALAGAKRRLNQTARFELGERTRIVAEIDALKSDLLDLRRKAEINATPLSSDFIELSFFCVLRPTLMRPSGLVVEAIDFSTNKPSPWVTARVVPGELVWHGGKIPFQVTLSSEQQVEVLPFDKNLDLLHRAGSCFEILARDFHISLAGASPSDVIQQIDAIIYMWASLSCADRTKLLQTSLSTLGFMESLDEVPSFESLRREISALDYLKPFFDKTRYEIRRKVIPAYSRSIAAEGVEKVMRNRFRRGREQADRYEQQAAKEIWAQGFKGAIITSIQSEVGRIRDRDLGQSRQPGDRKGLHETFGSLLGELSINASSKTLWQRAVDDILFTDDAFWDLAHDLLEKRAIVVKKLLDQLPDLAEKLRSGKHLREVRAAELVRLVSAVIEEGKDTTALETSGQIIADLSREKLTRSALADSTVDIALARQLCLYATHSQFAPEQVDSNELRSALANAFVSIKMLREQSNLPRDAEVFLLIGKKHTLMSLNRLTAYHFSTSKEEFADAKKYLIKNRQGMLDDYVLMVELLDDHLIELEINPTAPAETFDDFLSRQWHSSPTISCELNRRIGERLHFKSK